MTSRANLVRRRARGRRRERDRPGASVSMLGRKKKKARHANPWTALATPVRVEGAMMLELLEDEHSEPLNLREFMSAMFTADFLSAVHVLRAANVDADLWWSESRLDV
jgi:hypothetical protein